MKKNSKIIVALLVTVLFAVSCQKETKENVITSPETALQSAVKPKNECRLAFATNTDPTGSQNSTFRYNSEGLVNEWDIANYGLFTQEYDADGRLERSIHSVNGEVIFTVHFFYDGNGDKVQKEIYYFGTGTEVMDIAFYTYNAQGNVIKVQSFVSDYVAIATYTPQGNLLSNELFFSGSRVYSAFYTYDKPIKNPYRAVTGIDHAYPYYTAASFFQSKWQFSGLKELVYDENGDPIGGFEYDPQKTIWEKGHQNYTLSATYFDLNSESYVPLTYEYENCGPGANSSSNSLRKTVSTMASLSKTKPSLLLRRDPSKSFREQVQELRKKLKR